MFHRLKTEDLVQCHVKMRKVSNIAVNKNQDGGDRIVIF